MKRVLTRSEKGTISGGEGGGKRVAPSSSWGDDFGCIAGVTQLVECNLAKVDVEGSNPFARSGDLLVGQPR